MNKRQREIRKIQKKSSYRYQSPYENSFKQYMSPSARKSIEPIFLGFRRIRYTYDQLWNWNTLVEE